MSNVPQSASFRDRLRKSREGVEEKGEKGVYISGPGVFRVEIVSTEKFLGLDKEKLNRGIKDRNQPAYLGKFKVLQSNNPAHPVGSTFSWYVKDPEGANLSDIERLMWAAQGHDPSQIRSCKAADPAVYEQWRDVADGWAYASMNDAEALQCLGLEAGFCNGLEVMLETKVVDTKPKFAGGPPGKFTVHDWSPTPEAAAEPVTSI